MSKLGSTPWVDSAMRKHRKMLEKKLPADWLPRLLPPVAWEEGRPRVEELGCGSWGCVMPTGVEGLVVKVTADELGEARFVYHAFKLAEKEGFWPPGMVRYRRLLELKNTTHRGTQVWMLWREEAFELGFLKRGSGIAVANAAFLLTQYVYPALDAKQQLYHEGDPRLQGIRSAAEDLRDDPVMGPVGETLLYYMDHGVILIDVHSGNIGKVQRDGRLQAAITDPGTYYALNRKWYGEPK